MSDRESLAYLLARLGVVESRVRALVRARRSQDPDADDSFRGLYISDALVDRLLSAEDLPAATVEDAESLRALKEIEAWADDREASGTDLRLRRLCRTFQLSWWELQILLVALAPDLDSRFERLYGYLNDDVSRRRASLGLAMDLSGLDLRSSRAAETIGAFHAGSALRSGGLVVVEEPDRPLLTRPLRVPDRVIAHLLGDDRPDAAVAGYMIDPVPLGPSGLEPLTSALACGATPVYLRERSGTAGLSTCAAGMTGAGMKAVCLDLDLADSESLRGVIDAARMEARLAGGGLVAGPIDGLTENGTEAIRRLCEAGCPVVLLGSRSWDPTWSSQVPVLVDAVAPSLYERRSLWSLCLNGSESGEAALELATATTQFRLTPEQIRRAAGFAVRAAAASGRELTVADVQAGARAQNGGALERLTRRIEPGAGWEDLVVPADTLTQLRELTERARLRDEVYRTWRGSSADGRGVSALFAGDSGTGKTMSAEIVARALGLDLYVIDLSTVVNKYIGETEKNLERVFVEADRSNGVLLFDEADAIFGKRSEVQDAHDRYANVETAYLLQRIEQFDGLAILTTNLRSNIDEAFTRRLDAIVDFPKPDVEQRRKLWALHLRRGGSPVEELDLDFLAGSFELSGGNISNIVLSAAFLAAHDNAAIRMAHLIRATEREYRKLGHLCVPEEFGPYYDLISARAS